MDAKIIASLEQIRKRTKIDNLVGQLTLILTLSVSYNKFDYVSEDIESYFDSLLKSFDTFDRDESSAE